MDRLLEGLRLAAEWQGALLTGEGGPLLLIERVREHTGPRLALFGQRPEQLAPALEAWAASDVNLTLVGLVPLATTDLPRALQREFRRIGALLGALDLSQSPLGPAPHLVRRLPGLLTGGEAAGSELPLTGIQAFELRSYCDGLPAWAAPGRHWWEGPAPTGAEVLAEPLALPTAIPLTDALRGVLRSRAQGPVDFLPLPGDPRPLHALKRLTPAATVFTGDAGVWREVLARLAALPAPAHFCGRC
ncbi:MAG TPA: hypothetical protein VJ570_05750 [Holophagaceae bacterium]|nr:hypothetical protein [Holophagaceae bacterium]